LGVNIGKHLLGAHPSQPKGHFEDVDFYRLNMDILKAAGGSWDNPPTESRILDAGKQFEKRIKGLVQSRKGLWGWKDPRTCLTLPLYLPYLENPRFVLVYRKTSGIVGSLLRRSGGTKEKWERLIRIYLSSMEHATMQYAAMNILFERLITRKMAMQEIVLLNNFIGGNGNLKGALELIDFRL
jgi:hypothetical protein